MLKKRGHVKLICCAFHLAAYIVYFFTYPFHECFTESVRQVVTQAVKITLFFTAGPQNISLI